MLDGLLLALLGFTSDAIILEPPEDTPYGPKKGRFKLSQTFTARGEAER